MATHLSPDFIAISGDPQKTVLYLHDKDRAIQKTAFAGFSVVTAPSGKDALALFNSQRVNAVLMDSSVADASALVAAVRSRDPRMPVIVLGHPSSIADELHPMIDAVIADTQDAAALRRKLDSLSRLRSHSHPELERQPCVVFADSARRYVDCSDGACRLVGFPRYELLDMTIEDLSYRSERVSALFDKYKQRGNLDGQYILRHKNGKPVFISYRAHVFPDGCMAAVWEPVEDWKQLYQAALLEFDPEKLKDSVEVARAATHERRRQLQQRNPGNAAEWQQLDDALSAMNVLSRELAR